MRAWVASMRRRITCRCTAELQLRLAKKAVVAQWSRIANPKISPWGGAFATEFQPFADELAGDAPAYEALVRPAAVP
jgi:hypothetical protein